jgi:hypothetical protein
VPRDGVSEDTATLTRARSHRSSASGKIAAMQNQMNRMVRACAFAGLAVLLSGYASAQTGAEDIRARVKERQKVSITDDQGREFKGRTLANSALIGKQEP